MDAANDGAVGGRDGRGERCAEAGSGRRHWRRGLVLFGRENGLCTIGGQAWEDSVDKMGRRVGADPFVCVGAFALIFVHLELN